MQAREAHRNVFSSIVFSSMKECCCGLQCVFFYQRERNTLLCELCVLKAFWRITTENEGGGWNAHQSAEI